MNNNIHIVELFLNHKKINVNSVSIINGSIETPFLTAIKDNNIEIIELLIGHPSFDFCSSLNYSSYFNEIILNFASELNNDKIVKLFLPKTDINIQSIQIVFDLAFQTDNIDFIKDIISNQIVDNDFCETLLLIASKNRCIDIIDIVLPKFPETANKLKANKDFIEKITKVLMNSLKNNHTEFVKYMLTKFNICFNDFIYDEEYDVENLLTLAFKNNNTEIIKLLLKYPKIDVNSKYIKDCKLEYPLNIAIQNGNLEMINLLLSNPEIQVNNSPKRQINSTELIKWYKFHVEEKNSRYEGETALTTAIMNDNVEVVKLLLSREDIDVNGISIYFEPYVQEKTSLHVAIEKGNLEIIKLLLAHPKIDVNYFSKAYKNDYMFEKKDIEQAPIHIAAEKGNVEIMKLLLSHPKIDINSEMIYSSEDEFHLNVQKKTAFHIAVEKRDIDILKLMLDHPSLNVNSKLCIGSGKINYLGIFKQKHRNG